MNICTYTPDPNILTQAKVNREFALLHKYLCYLASQAGGSGTPGGANTDVQFNDTGAFGGSSNLTFDKATTTLMVGDASVPTKGLFIAGEMAIVDVTLPSLYFSNTAWNPGNPSSTSAFAINTHLSGGAVDFFCNGAFFPIFWADGSEVMRIPTSGNLLIGTITDSGDRLQVAGTALIATNGSGSMGITIDNQDAGAGSSGSITFNSDAIPNTSAIFQNSSNNVNFGGAFSLNIGTFVGGAVTLFTNDVVALTVNPSGNVMIGTQTTDGSKLQVDGAISTTSTVTSSIGGSAGTPVFNIGGDRGMWSNSSDVLNFTAGHGNSTLTLSDNGGFAGARIGGSPSFPTAALDIQTVSDGSAGTAPIKIPIGTLLATPEDGAFEYDGTHFYFTIGVTRHTIV